MKLNTIYFARPIRVAARLIPEGITRTDFFDLYSLLAAYQDPNTHGDPRHEKEIRQRLDYELRYVYHDQMDQLFAIIADRLMESESDEDTDAVLSVFEKWDIPIHPEGEDGLPVVDREGLAAISYDQRARFLKDLVAYRQHNIQMTGVTGLDGVWATLADKYGQLAHVGTDTRSLYMAVDRIYGLAHHGGLLADYFDESDWLEDALNMRSVGEPGQFIRYASSDVRNLVSTAAHSSHPGEITPLMKLSVALTKTGLHTKSEGKTLRVTANYTVWTYSRGSGSVLVATDGRPPVTDAEAEHIRLTRLGVHPAEALVSYGPDGLQVETGGKTVVAQQQGVSQYQLSRQSRVAQWVVGVLKNQARARFADKAPPDAMWL